MRTEPESPAEARDAPVDDIEDEERPSLRRRWLTPRGIYAIARRVVMVIAVVGLALMVRRYDFGRLDPSAEASVVGLIRPGAFVVFADIDADLPLARGSLVEAEVEVESEGKKARGVVLGRIEAEPGDTVLLHPDGNGFLLQINREVSDHRFKKRPAFPEGEIPAGHFLILRPSPAGSGYDARQFGLLTRADFRRKLITYL